MRKTLLILLIIHAVSCSVKERPIAYGVDECDYCKMKIMDHRYGSELVTQKGKVYTFDAAECLIDFLYHNKEMEEEARYLLVTPYTAPDHLTDATKATYLVSREMPSPMGAYLTSFQDDSTAKEFQRDKGGALYSWEVLYRDFRTIKRNVISESE